MGIKLSKKTIKLNKMGLDIYLYRYDNFEDTQRREKEHSEFSDKNWKSTEGREYESLTEEEKDEIRRKDKENATSLGLDDWGSDKTRKEKIEFDCERYPDHYFKVGYFRSSYNSGGIERILRNMGLPTLSEVFKAGDEYEFQPNWEESLEAIDGLIALFKAKGAYRVNSVSANMFRDSEVKSEARALEIFLEQMEKAGENPEYNYTNAEGEFYLNEPIKVLAMIPGKEKIFGERDCVYVVTESDNSWYLQALEIVKETIEYVLSRENKEQYYLHWSG
jgi:hypothetical protein